MADSTCESKYIIAIEATKESMGLKNFVGDLRVVPSIQETIEIFYDNEGRSRHIERKYQYIRHKVEEGTLVVNCVSSEDNPVDPITKGLIKIKHFKHAWSIRLRDDVSF